MVFEAVGELGRGESADDASVADVEVTDLGVENDEFTRVATTSHRR